MTPLVSIAAVVLVAALLVAARRRGRRQHTYVCRICHASFSDPDAAFLHWEAMHGD